MGLHAIKGASGAKRWMACPGSLARAVGRPNESGEAAMEGTAAHHLGEVCLKSGEDAEAYLGKFIGLDQQEDCFFEEDIPLAQLFNNEAPYKAIFPVNANMVDAVQVYLNAVRDDMLVMGPDAELAVEQHCDLSWLRPGMFGTNDARLLLLFEELSVYDYKHGQGVTVEVAEYLEIIGPDGPTGVFDLRPNIQLVYYAIGAAHACGWAFERVKITVVQPRKAHSDGPVRSFTFTKAELLQYADELGAASDVCDEASSQWEEITSGDEQLDWEHRFLKAGSHCQFCPSAGTCPELEKEVYRQAEVDFADDGSASCPVVDAGTTDAHLARAMRVIPILDIFIKATETEALRRLRASDDGTGFGYKLVRKRSIRKWTADEAQVAEFLIGKGFDKESLYQEPKFKSPTQVEELRPPALMAAMKEAKVRAPAKAIKAMVAELAFKPEGGVTIAPDSDPRDAIPPSSTAASDFDVVEE